MLVRRLGLIEVRAKRPARMIGGCGSVALSRRVRKRRHRGQMLTGAIRNDAIARRPTQHVQSLEPSPAPNHVPSPVPSNMRRRQCLGPVMIERAAGLTPDHRRRHLLARSVPVRRSRGARTNRIELKVAPAFDVAPR